MKNFLKIFGIIMLSVFAVSFIQARIISGTITDNSGNPVSGVAVSTIPSSGNTTYSLSDGTYSISIGQETTKLVFSRAGFITREVAPGKSNVINVKLEPAIMVQEMHDAAPMRREAKMAMPSAYMSSQSAGYPAVGGINRYNGNFNTEGYASVNENGFRDVKSNPLSTFSIDVDNASYSNIRRFINNGQLPPPDAVRIEEMINYFRYNYQEPKGEHPFSVYTELAVCPWNRKHTLLHV
ncbi:MAG: VWA domain-containing protein, partial [Chloroflexota bacterium]